MKLAVLVSLLVIVPFQVVTASCVGKTVEVWVANGQSLTGDGPLSEPDPYVKVSCFNIFSQNINKPQSGET